VFDIRYNARYLIYSGSDVDKIIGTGLFQQIFKGFIEEFSQGDNFQTGQDRFYWLGLSPF